MKKKLFKMIAHTLLLSFGYQLVFPAYAYALTTGPSQPEVQSFEPVGTTEMVDMFSGDFNYNIPLMDVEGYPINIFYHSGVGIEQEASWVGLGWNINPGEINRNVRGIPDDFNGETIEKYTKIKEEKDVRVGYGTEGAIEIFGRNLGLSTSQGIYISQNNYRGLSAGINTSVGLTCPVGSIGIGLGIGTQTGADVDMYGSLKTPDLMGRAPMGVSVNGGVGYNSRSGLKDISLGMNATINPSRNVTVDKQTTSVRDKIGTGVSTTIPVGMQNYVPVITNAMHQVGLQAQLKVGVTSGPVSAFAYINVMKTNVTYDPDASKKAYGYLYMENARKTDILDFSREKDGVYNKTLKNLPASGMAYDIYSINGHGTGGMFRPFRNDIGTIFDPYMYPGDDKNRSVQLEAAAGNYAEVGDDATWITTTNKSGQWVGLDFSSKTPGSLFENVFFKQAGELTYNQQQEVPQLFNNTAQYLEENGSGLIAKGNINAGTLPLPYTGGRIMWDNYVIDRSSRATNISWQTAEQVMRIPEMDGSKKIVSYNNATNFYDPALVKYNRYEQAGVAGPNHNARPHHISEFTQTSPDGRRYVYGIPAMNNATREVTMAVDEPNADLNTGYVTYTGEQDSKNNNTGRDKFYSSTVTPAYAHSYLLTSLLSADYVDVLGDGPTDDDLGSFVKYNYTLKDNDYRWRTPYPAATAQYSPGFWTDNQDGKGNYIVGSRQQWNVRSIESKNYVAEFYTSPRLDGKGVKDAVVTGGAPLGSASVSYKLDSIRLFNKHDRYLNEAKATPIKTVIFAYSYTLCKGVPNSFTTGTPAGTLGKLTLDKIFIKYGNSQKNLLSPYVFEYKGANPDYSFAAKDRWGNYKKVVPGVHNYEFPYTGQPDVPAERDEQNAYLSAWNLTDIKLPSGGKIHVDYESDDYSFVQDKRSMQMLKIEGVGSTTKMVPQDKLYNGKDDINDYVYFKRRISRENSLLSLRDNYLEGQDLLYYSFAIDITATGKYEPIKGYAKIDEVGYCSDPAYAYIKLKREDAKGVKLHPASLLGINTGRYYLPHIFYEGYEAGDVFGLAISLAKKFPELLRTIAGQNPFKDFIRKQKAKRLVIADSWIRLQTPGLTKKGGGIRVKQLTLSDNWNNIAGNEESKYGKKYDYTLSDPRYGTISSGVASYEPMIGADENPFRMPVPYSAEKGRGIPSVDFFQEEPFGESFFPGASVGYSSVRVSSIHEQYGRSSQAVDEYGFYTAKDYPVKVDYTEKKSTETTTRRLFEQKDEAKALQGYCITMNDMHGKPKSVNNYVLRKNGTAVHKELITGTKYNYNEDAQHQLNNKVRALVRKRGTQSNFEMKDVFLGQDIDFTVDSRFRSAEVNTRRLMFNVNVLSVFGAPIPVFSTIYTNKYTAKEFKSLVSTKIIQQYGILRSVEATDHEATTTTENMVYDAETGATLLTRTNNEYNQYSANLTHPAYLAYEGMRPAYTNDAYEEIADSLVVNYDREGYLYTNNFDRFTDGDELLVESKSFGREFMKLWVTGVGVDTSRRPIPDTAKGTVSFAKVRKTSECDEAGLSVTIKIDSQDGLGFLTRNIMGTGSVCDHSSAYTRTLKVGTYNFTATINTLAGPIIETGKFRITKGACSEVKFEGRCREYGDVYLSKWIKSGCPSMGSIRYLIKTAATPEVTVASNVLEFDNDFSSDALPTRMKERVLLGNYKVYATLPGSASAPGFPATITVRKEKIVDLKLFPAACGGLIIGELPSDITGGASEPGSEKTVTVTVIDRYEASVPVYTTVSTRCALTVAPRYKDKYAGGATVNQSTWPADKKVYKNVRFKVIRSGRRNNLDKSVQQTSLAVSATNTEATTLTKLFQPASGILSAAVSTFTDEAQIYTPFADEMTIAGDFQYKTFNDFVLGKRGNFRPLATYAPIADRLYAQVHSRYDGIFSMPESKQFWSAVNGRAVPAALCDTKTDLFAQNTLAGSQYWKMASKVTRYDIFGNALEEQDAIGNYSAAQYGYNKALPMAVAANARYQQFMFDGFEDYAMLVPQKIAALFLTGDLYSAFRVLFDRTTPEFSRYGQNYVTRSAAAYTSGVFVLNTEFSHTGFYSMKTNASVFQLSFLIGNAEEKTLSSYSMAPGKKHLLQLWIRNASPASGFTGDLPKTKVSLGTGTINDMTLKAGGIDNWYLFETVLDLTSVPGGGMQLFIPPNVYVDDIRILPLTANMKSFVYDPISFKLVAQLDENHMATYFEYDQEGLLIRTKKETAKGIMTISESRRANNKKNLP